MVVLFLLRVSYFNLICCFIDWIVKSHFLQAKPDTGKLILATIALLIASTSNIMIVCITRTASRFLFTLPWVHIRLLFESFLFTVQFNFDFGKQKQAIVVSREII